jgi:hypothetical protein
VFWSFEDIPPDRARQNNCMAPRMSSGHTMNISYLGLSLSTSMVLTGFAGSTAVNSHSKERLKVIKKDSGCYGDVGGPR